jgi:3D (Asp-Asp-Asp) domain-containing protein
MTAWIAVVSTAYCLSGQMADGSQVRDGSVASNAYPLGSELEIRPSPTGRRYYRVRDRIGWGTQLDFWLPTCSAARAWGRRTVRIRRARWASVLVPVGRGPAHHPTRRVRRERVARVDRTAAHVADQPLKQRLLDRPMQVVDREHHRPDAGEQAPWRDWPPVARLRVHDGPSVV